MSIHLSDMKFRRQPGPTKASALWVAALGLLLSFGANLDSAHAQLGIPEFSLISGGDNDLLGSATAAGDFNGDGFDDLAIGMPGSDVDGFANAGRVRIYRGGPGAFQFIRSLRANQLGGSSAAAARFGSALAVGNFDNDDYEDLAVGVPGSTVNGESSAGEIYVIYGSPNGLAASSAQSFSQIPLPGAPEEDDRLGTALAAGDLSADGIDDLAVGVPFEDIQGTSGLREDVGAINILYGVDGVGLTSQDSQLITENTPGVGLNANADERFGFSLAIGQFTHNGNTDLAVGAPGETVFGAGLHGAVILFPGAPGGLDTVAGQEVVFSQMTEGVFGTLGDGDEFGYSLAPGDFDGDSWTDLAIGAPGENELGTTESGAVHILYGGPIGLTAFGDQFLVEGTIDADVDAFDRFGTALEAGDFDSSGQDDLAIGAPLDNSLGVANSGEVTVLYGTSTGLSFASHQVFDMIFFGTLEIGDLFGFALAAGNFFTKSSGEDLAIGIPSFDTSTGSNNGATVVVQSQPMFRSGFETGDVSEWSSSVP